MEEGFEKKYCPLLKRACLREQCEWWTGRGEYARCAVRVIDDNGFKLYKILQALQGGGGGGGRMGGGGSADFGPDPDDF